MVCTLPARRVQLSVSRAMDGTVRCDNNALLVPLIQLSHSRCTVLLQLLRVAVISRVSSTA